VPTIILLYLLKSVYPGHVFLLRGDDEFESFCEGNGFLSDITVTYPEDTRLFQVFVRSFSFMPIAAVIGGGTVCLHSGIGPMIESLDYVRKLRRPIVTYSEPVVCSIMCSDPSLTTQTFATPASPGCLFGEKALLTFLERSGAVRLVRSHQFMPHGSSSMFDDRLVTIFSASNYAGKRNNECAVLVIQPDGDDELKTFAPLPYLSRSMLIKRRIDAIRPPPIIAHIGRSKCASINPSAHRKTFEEVRGSIGSSRSFARTPAVPPFSPRRIRKSGSCDADNTTS
jgi:hypothetical protein